MYIRFWLDAVVAGERSLTDLDGLPVGLDGLYYDSLDRVVKLGEAKWRSDYAPLLLNLAGKQTTLETWQQIQAVERLFE